ncbi:hypothetical protein [Cytobacillus sp. IB215316]|uniref:hypothetical protein n=1 Tax=Cytobacillus sp. IB215316 TaxID=3097354 RepID=UPI002A0E01B9|nr:hypothetical protein [Cytobacillus sp. IB215316]MDX8360770.1 hypothetical protein [Cytobacillus sp. IB215316]
MSRFFGLINITSLLFFAALIVGFVNYVKNETDEIEQLRLSYAIDYATDAGAQEMLRTGSLDMDYGNHKYLNINPELALESFLNVFAFNYDMVPSEENKQTIKQYMPVAAVATFDGVYLANHQLVRNRGGNYPEGPVNDADWDLIFGMKTPYTHNDSGVSYALNMGMSYTIAIDGNVMRRDEGLPPRDGVPLTKQQAWSMINKIISQDMAYSINKTNEHNPDWANNFYIPDSISSVRDNNSIQGPSFITLVQGLDFTTPRPISAFSISGSKIDQARMVGAYIRNVNGEDIKYYAYLDKIPEVDIGASIQLINVFSTVREAASEGYYHDSLYMD